MTVFNVFIIDVNARLDQMYIISMLLYLLVRFVLPLHLYSIIHESVFHGWKLLHECAERDASALLSLLYFVLVSVQA